MTASGVTSVGVSPVPPVVRTTARARVERVLRRAARIALDVVGHDPAQHDLVPGLAEQRGEQLAAVVGPLAARPSGSSR